MHFVGCSVKGSDAAGRPLSDVFRKRVLEANEVRRFADSLVDSDKRGIRHLRHYLTPVFDQGRYAPDCHAWPISYRPKAHFVHAFGRTPGGILQLQTHAGPGEDFRSDTALCHTHPSVKTAFQSLKSLVGRLCDELAQKQLIAIGKEAIGDTARIPEQWWESETTWVDFGSGMIGAGSAPDATLATSILGTLGARFDIFSNVIVYGSSSAPDVPVSSLLPSIRPSAATDRPQSKLATRVYDLLRSQNLSQDHFTVHGSAKRWAEKHATELGGKVGAVERHLRDARKDLGFATKRSMLGHPK